MLSLSFLSLKKTPGCFGWRCARSRGRGNHGLIDAFIMSLGLRSDVESHEKKKFRRTGPSAVGLLFCRVRLLLQVLRPDTVPVQTLLRFTMHLCLWSCTGPRPSGTHLEPACHGLVGGLEAAAACVCDSIVVSKEFIHVQPCCWCSCQFLSEIHQSRRKL